MERTPLGSVRGAVLLLLALSPLLVAGGCANVLAGAMWLVKGTNMTAKCNALQGKRVVVVCRPPVELQFSDGAAAANELAIEISRSLDANVKKIEVVENSEVEEWTDEHTWQEYTEVGEALDADVIVGVDLNSFNMYPGQNLYQGTASFNVTAYDMRDGGRVIFEESLQAKYPPNNPQARDNKPSPHFRREFVRVLARKASRLFYDYDSFADYDIDSPVL